MTSAPNPATRAIQGISFLDRSKKFAAGLTVAAAVATGVVVLNSHDPQPVVAADYKLAGEIVSPGVTGALSTVNGTVFLDRAGWGTVINQDDVMMGGVTVKAYWVDEDGAVSPTYVTTSNADGTYSILMQDWVDANGKKHVFDAGAAERLQAWIVNPDQSKYYVAFQEANGTLSTSTGRIANSWNSANKTVSNNLFALNERPEAWLSWPNPTPTLPPDDAGFISGIVFVDQNFVAGAPSYPTAGVDPVMPGVKVVASYLNDEVSRRIDAWKNAHPAATRDDLKTAQQQIIAAYEAQTGVPGSAIAESVTATTDANGRYYAQFRGLWGDSRNFKGISNKGTFGTLAPDAVTGSWSAGTLQSKHTNTDYMYVYPIPNDAFDIRMSSFQDALFQSPLDFGAGTGSTILNGANGIDFAMYPADKKFDVTPYDTTLKPAGIGDTAQTVATGLSAGTQYSVQWKDSSGAVVATCPAVAASFSGTLPSCPFTVPATLTQPTIYTAYLINAAGQMSEADSFMALPFTTSTEPGSVGDAYAGTVKLVPPAGSTVRYSASGLPAGLVIDPVTGAVTGTPTAAGTTNVTYTATITDAKGNVTTMNKIAPLTVTDTPLTNGQVGSAYSNIVTPIGLPEGAVVSNMTVSGLPAGLSFDSATGQITGTPTAAGTTAVKITYDYTLPDGSVVKAHVDVDDLVINPASMPLDTTAPTLQEIPNQEITVGQPMQVAKIIAADDSKVAPTIAVSGLTDGMTYDPATNTISGTPTVVGLTTITITATDAAGNVATRTFTVNVLQGDTTAPVLAPVSDVTAPTGQAIKPISIVASDQNGVIPTVTVSGLPDGLSYDPVSGQITGTPTTAGTYPITVTAKDPAGNTTTTTFTITTFTPDTTGPVIDPIADQTVKAGTAMTDVPVKATDDSGKPVTISVATSDVPGVVFDSATNTIKGIPTEPGTYEIPVTAMDASGNISTITWTLTVLPEDVTVANKPIYDQSTAVKAGATGTVPAPTFDNPATDKVETNSAPAGTKFSAESLPAWATLNADGSISVAPDASVPAGSYTTNVTVTYPDGTTDVVPVTITVVAPDAPADATKPVIDTIGNFTVPEGSPITPIKVTASDDSGVPPTIAVSGLPANLTFDPNTGEITGTPIIPGVHTVTVTAIDAAGNSVTTTFTITVQDLNALNDAIYKDGTVMVGSALTIPAPRYDDPATATVEQKDAPTGTIAEPSGTGTVFVAEGITTVDGVRMPTPPWIIVNPDGTISANPDYRVATGDYIVDIRIIYPDGSSEVVQSTITVIPDETAPVITPIADQTVDRDTAIKPIQVVVTDPDDTKLTVTVSNLPDGVTYDTATGMISGTPTAAGSYLVTVTATDIAGNQTSTTFTINVNQVSSAEFNNPNYEVGNTVPQNGSTVITAPTFDLVRTTAIEQLPAPVDTTYKAAAGAPTWATVNADGSISVDAAGIAPGTYSIPVEVTYQNGSTNTAVATITVNPVAQTVLNQPVYKTGTSAVAGATQPTVVPAPTFDNPATPVTETAGMPAGTTFATPGAPAWVTVNPDGSLSLLPGADVAPGAYLIPVEVTYADGTKDTVEVPVYVAPPTAVVDSQPPVIADIADQTYQSGATISSLEVKATDDSGITPTFAVTGLPAGLKFDPVANIIFGTPTTPGKYQVTVTAYDQAGNSDSITFTVVVEAEKIADITTPIYDTTTSVPAGGHDAIPAPLMDDPRTPEVETAPLPAGSVVTKDPSQPDTAPWATINPDGSVTVSPDGTVAPGVYILPLIVTYPDGTTDVTKIPVTVTDPAAPADTTAPAITQVDDQTITAGDPITSVIPVVDDKTATILVNRMPAGVTYDPATNTISGTPTVTGTFPVTITAIDAAGNSTTSTFNITINPAPVVETQPPTVEPIADASGTVGTPIAPITIVAKDSSLPLDVAVTGLPDGLTFNPATGEITGTPTTAGTSTVTVVVTDSAGNKAEPVTFQIVVAEAAKTAATTDPIYVGAEVPAGHETTINAPTFTNPAPGATFAPGTGMPSWATVDPVTGAITVKPGTAVVPGTVALPITVTYPDGSTDTVTVPVQILPADITAIDYEPRVDVVPGVPATDTPKIIGDSTGAVFAIQNNTLPDGATATVDGSGVVTVQVPEGTPAGRYTLEVITKIPGQPDQIDVITVVVPQAVVPAAENTLFTPAYAAATATPGTPVVAQVTGMAGAPAGTTYSIPAGILKNLTDSGWTVTIDPATGEVKTTAPATAADKTTVTIPVTVTYPDGSPDLATLILTVNNPEVTPSVPMMDTVHQPGYLPVTVQPGQTITMPQSLADTLPTGTGFSLLDGVVPAGWTVTVDPTTGALTVTAPSDATEGSEIPIAVVVKYPDGTSEVIHTTVTVGKPTALAKAILDYPANVAATPGTELSIPVTVSGNNGAIPAGTYIDVNGTALPAGSVVSVDQATGALKVTIPADAVGGPFPVLVTVSVPGMPTVTDTIMVALPTATAETPTYPTTVSAEQNTPTEIAPQIDGKVTTFPPGTEISIDSNQFPGTVTVQPNGTITVTGTTPGTNPIVVTISVPGKEPVVQTINVTVGESAKKDAATNDPGYGAGDVKPGASTVVQQTGDTSLPAGTKFEIVTSALPAGWTATVDATTGAVTVTAPAGATPGTSVKIPVRVIYPDNSEETVEMTVNVGEPGSSTGTDAATNDPGYILGDVKPGSSTVVKQTGDTSLPAGTKFEIDTSTLPAGWTATVDATTGDVTVNAPADAPVGLEVHVPVTVTYPDGSIDVSTVTVTVGSSGATVTDAAANNPGYEAGDVKPGSSTVVKQTGDTSLPAGTKFEIDTSLLPDGWTATVDATTGAVTVNAPAGAPAGLEVHVPVTVTYPDGTIDVSVVSVSTGKAPVVAADNSKFNPTYVGGTAAPGIPTSASVLGMSGAPSGTTFNIPADVMKALTAAGWTVSIDSATGRVTATAPATAVDKSAVTIPVTVTYPDGSVDVALLELTVDNPAVVSPDPLMESEYQPGYDSAKVLPGKSVTVAQSGEFSLPVGTSFQLVNGVLPAGWTVTVDRTSGDLTVTAPAGAAAGMSVPIAVIVTYPDGTSEVVTTTVEVDSSAATGTDAAANNPGYGTGAVEPGSSTVVKQTGDTSVPSGTKFEIDTSKLPAGWTATVNGTTGDVTVTAPAGATAGLEVHVPVKVTYPDGSVDVAVVTVSTGPAAAFDNAKFNPVYKRDDVTPGTPVVVPVTGMDNAPDGTKFEIDTSKLPAGWTATVDSKTGAVTVNAPANAPAGLEVHVPVKVTYPDGSVDVAVVTVSTGPANAFDNAKFNPVYQGDDVTPGTPVVVPVTGMDNAPDGTKYEIDTSKLPAGWTATIDGKTGAVTVNAPAGAVAGTEISIPVKVTYPDGSFDLTVVKVKVGEEDKVIPGSSGGGLITAIIGGAVIGGLIAGSSDGLTSSGIIGGSSSGSTTPGQPGQPGQSGQPGRPSGTDAGQPFTPPAPAKLPSAPINGDQRAASAESAGEGQQPARGFQVLAQTGLQMFKWLMMLGAMFLAVGAAIIAFVRRGRSQK